MAPAVHRKMFAPSPVTKRFAREFPVELEMRPLQIRASAGEATLVIPGAAGLAKHHSELSLRVAIMAGLGDKIVDDASQAERLGAELPGSTLIKVPGIGYMIHYIVPERVAAVIRDLVRAATLVGKASTRGTAA